jgi:hypothetical protein
MGKNKNLIIAAVVIILIALGAAGYLLMNQNQAPAQTESSTSIPQEQNTDVFSTIKDALSKSLSLQCEFTDEEGRKTVSYIKNGQVRADITSSKPEESGSVIVKDKKMYFWNSRGGFTMEFTDEMMDSAESSAQGQDIIENLEKYKQSCRAATVSDALFSPPSDVEFQDMSDMMKMVPTGDSAMPSVDQKQVEEMMKQYQNR